MDALEQKGFRDRVYFHLGAIEQLIERESERERDTHTHTHRKAQITINI